MSAPRDPEEQAPDWPELRASIQRRLAHHLRGWTPEEIEDATHDVLFKLLRFMERSGMPDSIDALTTVIARRTAAERIRIRTRRPVAEPLSEATSAVPDDSERRELAELEDQVSWRAFQVMAFLREHQPACVELAEARARGLDFARFAEQTGQSHAALLQRWSRGMRRLREAIEQGRVPWDGPDGDEP